MSFDFPWGSNTGGARRRTGIKRTAAALVNGLGGISLGMVFALATVSPYGARFPVLPRRTLAATLDPPFFFPRFRVVGRQAFAAVRPVGRRRHGDADLLRSPSELNACAAVALSSCDLQRRANGADAQEATASVGQTGPGSLNTAG